MSKITFLGFPIAKDDIHPGVHVSGNRMQNGLVEALYEDYGDALSVLSVYPVASFPKTKTVIVKSGRFSLDCGIKAKRIGFINVFILKQITQAFNVYRALKECIRKNAADLVVCFNPYWIFAEPLFRIRAKSLKRVCIIADIPVTVPASYHALKRCLRRYEIKNYYKTIKKFDGLIVLNREVSKEFAPELPYVVMDGGVTQEETQLQPLPCEEHDWKQILFTGALEPYNCVQEIIEAFLAADVDGSKLIICGFGTMADYVKEVAEKHPSIDYLGAVSNEKAKDLQRSSGLLMNIRSPDQYAMRLTFPSKVIEYMLSGTPVLTTKINGLGEDYLQNMFVTEGSVTAIAEKIREICQIPIERRAIKAARAREFIINNKRYQKHCERIIPFLENEIIRGAQS